MKECNAKAVGNESASAVRTLRKLPTERQYPAYIGLDVHKESIAVAVARAGREAAVSRGEIANQPKALVKLVERLNREFEGEVLLFCYEAGPCGYGVYRQLLGLGQDCQVVAPSLIPKKPGERIKTDRRDACKLAGALRNGDLTAVWVPDEEQEALRDLTRARDDLKVQERKARQQLNAYVLRQGHACPLCQDRCRL
jgi:transposase